MKLFRVSKTAVMLFMILISAAVASDQQDPPQGPPPPAGSGITTDGTYLFVMAGDNLYQYTAADLSLVTTVKLARPAPPAESDTQNQSSKFMARWTEKVKNIREKVSGDAFGDNQTQPPPPPAGSGLCTDGASLFMLRGHSIQQYTVADMTLVKSVDLPKPEPPTAD